MSMQPKSIAFFLLSIPVGESREFWLGESITRDGPGQFSGFGLARVPLAGMVTAVRLRLIIASKTAQEAAAAASGLGQELASISTSGIIAGLQVEKSWPHCSIGGVTMTLVEWVEAFGEEADK